MNTLKVIGIILGVLVGLWVVGKVIGLVAWVVNIALPLLIVGAIAYGVYKLSTSKALPWQKRSSLP